jgi:hypothetical protein
MAVLGVLDPDVTLTCHVEPSETSLAFCSGGRIVNPQFGYTIVTQTILPARVWGHRRSITSRPPQDGFAVANWGNAQNFEIPKCER